MKLVIDRRYWLRGTGGGCLLDHENKMCCLGFLGTQCGYQKEEILGLGSPQDCANELRWPEAILSKEKLNSGICKILMEINDDPRYSEEKREEFLKEHFKKIQIDLEFIN